jgi:hypothetical protein
MKKGDLSKFIERAVQKEILAQTAADVKRRNADRMMNWKRLLMKR